jgi:hypothetical protein
VVVFLRNDVVSHIVAHETHQRLWKISFATPKDFFNSIGTKLTYCCSRRMSAVGG